MIPTILDEGPGLHTQGFVMPNTEARHHSSLDSVNVFVVHTVLQPFHGGGVWMDQNFLDDQALTWVVSRTLGCGGVGRKICELDEQRVPISRGATTIRRAKSQRRRLREKLGCLCSKVGYLSGATWHILCERARLDETNLYVHPTS